MAYGSEDGGLRQVFVQRFPAAGGKWQVSTPGRNSTYPRWRPDGKELFFDSSGTMMAVDLTGTVPGGAFTAGASQRLFPGLVDSPPHNFDVAADGRRFLIVTGRSPRDELAPIVVVLNWMTGLK